MEIEFEEVELADGSTIKVLKEEKVTELQAGFETLKIELETSKTELDTELEKEKAKDKNFSRLREKKLSELSDEEKANISEDRQELMAQREEYASDRAMDQKIRLDSWKTSAFKSLGLMDPEGTITDEDAHKRVDTAFARLNDPEDSVEAVLRKAKAAYSLEFGGQPNVGQRSVNSAVPFGGGGNIPKPKKDLSEAQQNLAGRLGINLNPDNDKK